MSLKHLVEQRINHTMQHKRLCKLLGLDYTIEYKKGVENKVACALSRKEGRIGHFGQVMTLSELVPQWVNDTTQSYESDPWIDMVKQRIIENETYEKLYNEEGDILRYKGRLCIGEKAGWREKLLVEMYDSRLGGHSGMLGTYQRMKKLFYWPKLKESVHEHVRNYEICQMSKAEHVKVSGLLQALDVPKGAWESISMYFISGLPRSEGKIVIMVVVDRFTKCSHFLALSYPFTATGIA
jgi:Integrase zinc binding domain